MSEVSLTVGGRRYTVACAPGEEDHITKLGEMIDAKLAQMGNLAPQDSQNLLFAGLLLADELYESKDAVAGAAAAKDALQSARDKAELDNKAAADERKQLKKAASDHEATIANLQKAQAESAEKLKAAETELEGLKAIHSSSAEADNSAAGKLAALKAERDALAKQLEELANRPAFAAASSITDDPELAPALERFADLLENCADKLERKVVTP